MEAPATAVNPSEIRLGNWFEHHPVWSHRNHIKCADPDRFVFQWEERDWSAIGECLFSLDCISPIPITAEMLVKSGFSEREHYIIPKQNRVLLRYELYVKCEYGSVGFDFFENADGYLCFYLDFMEPDLGEVGTKKIHHIKYVHQLQNIHYSITGQELEIKWK
jgi:hypothetical protein